MRLWLALEDGLVLAHPFVTGELACGSIANRTQVLSSLQNLPRSPVATHVEALAFIERYSLMRRGIGYVDVHLLAAAALASADLWTRERRLAAVARELNLAYQP